MRRIVTHALVVGATQSGKTYYLNQAHRRWPGTGIFADYKAAARDRIWGVPIRDLSQLRGLLLRGERKVRWILPRRNGEVDMAAAREQLRAVWLAQQAIGSRVELPLGQGVQWTVDEFDRWCVKESEGGDDGALVDDIAARALGMGGRLVGGTQHPTGVRRTTTRNNMETRVVFALGEEGERCLQQWGWDLGFIRNATRQPYHFATYHRLLGWRAHKPLGA